MRPVFIFFAPEGKNRLVRWVEDLLDVQGVGATAAFTLGVAHATGFPLYCLLAKAAALLSNITREATFLPLRRFRSDEVGAYATNMGLALNELNLPTGLLSFGSDILEGVSVDAWIQYEW